ncbi:hypothetical protein Taro_027971 [Colocasia esculenta]|uniref:Uncharacterized protein n=1 Tax=Colocasia esculenta TaxID=4460 RepID=A0A843VVV9_COLES|nr:hypothetical protein [Colocasia esculenta]
MAHNTKARSKTTEIRSSSNDLIQDRFIHRNLCRTSCTNLIDEIRKNKLRNILKLLAVRRLRVSFQWRPRRCSVCSSFGHADGSCKPPPKQQIAKVFKEKATQLKGKAILHNSFAVLDVHGVDEGEEDTLGQPPIKEANKEGFENPASSLPIEQSLLRNDSNEGNRTILLDSSNQGASAGLAHLSSPTEGGSHKARATKESSPSFPPKEGSILIPPISAKHSDLDSTLQGNSSSACLTQPSSPTIGGAHKKAYTRKPPPSLAQHLSATESGAHLTAFSKEPPPSLAPPPSLPRVPTPLDSSSNQGGLAQHLSSNQGVYQAGHAHHSPSEGTQLGYIKGGMRNSKEGGMEGVQSQLDYSSKGGSYVAKPVAASKGELINAQNYLAQNPHDEDLISKENEARENYATALAIEENYIRQKSRLEKQGTLLGNARMAMAI